jgi:tetraacyldisaccharide 4'-kinase
VSAAERRDRLTEVMAAADRSLPAALARGGLSALVPAYALASAAHRAVYRWGLRRRIQLGVPVLSVGNLTAGGTGKTPLVQWLAARARDGGHRVAVLLRGYRGARTKGGVRGDEGELLRTTLPGVLVLEGRDRAAGGARAVAEGCDRVILDDGFQHHRLARDVDVVTIDALRPFGFGHLLPRGLLRERLPALARASAIVVTRTEHVSEDVLRALEQEIDSWSGGKPRTRARHEPVALRWLESGSLLPSASIRGARAVALSGIGHPEAFERTVCDLGVSIEGRLRFADHQHYGTEQLRGIESAARAARADWIVTTEKDAVKLAGVRLGIPIVSVVIELKLDSVPTPMADFVG